ncbi:ABC transporter transmembrane domain-containing protein, partial [Rhodococcoides fascians]|uniref:ABC transporter transmembrane domain-containing protein n=1 Tax=Rhodococcoides fascians TaxID=1828 RepID=UPI001F117D1A
PWAMMRSLSRDDSVKNQELAPGTWRRVLSYAAPYKGTIIGFLVTVVIGSVLVVAVPLLLKALIDDGVIPKDSGLVVRLSLIIAGLALLDAVLTIASRLYSATIGEGLIRDLRTEVFGHVLKQPIAFFNRA